MLRKTIYATLIVILMVEAASAQQGTHTQGLPGYSNAERSDAEKKNDKDIDRAYQSTIKGRPDAEKNLIRGAISVRLLHQRRQRRSNNYQPAAASRRLGQSKPKTLALSSTTTMDRRLRMSITRTNPGAGRRRNCFLRTRREGSPSTLRNCRSY